MASYEQAKSLLIASVSRRTLYSISIQNRGKGKPDPNKELTRPEKEYLKLFANRITIPGISIKAMTALGQENMGIMRSTPNEVRHGNNQLLMQVIEDSNYTAMDMMRKLFDQMAVNANPRGINRNIRMKYYNEYIRDIVVDKLEFMNKSVKQTASNRSASNNDLDFGYKRVGRYTFENCYLNNIGEYVLDSGAYDGFLEFPVVFSYESYHYNEKVVINNGRE